MWIDMTMPDDEEYRAAIMEDYKKDIVVSCPNAILEWDYIKNQKYLETCKHDSDEVAWWICKNCGKSYAATIKNYISDGVRCPCCNDRG